MVANGSHVDARAAGQQVRREPRPDQAPTAKPASASTFAASPRRSPSSADSATQATTIRSAAVTPGLYRPCGPLCHTAGVELVTIESTPKLNRPTMVAAFRGWNDAGGAASLAAGYLRSVTDAERFASIDSEPFVDYQQTRPTVHARRRRGARRRVAGDRGVRASEHTTW